MCVEDPSKSYPTPPAVLVVDADPLTRSLIAYLMSRWAVDGDVVDAPQEAVAKLPSRRYDLVLVDANLPEAAETQLGLGAYREGSVGVVVLMTSVETSPAAGGTLLDRIAKPITAERLREVFVRYSILPADAAMTPPPSHDSSPLKSLLDDEDMIELVQDYAMALPSRLADIRAAVDGGDLSRVVKLAHQLKGAGGMYGYPDLSQVAALLEQAAKEGHQEDLLSELLGEADALVDRIKRGLTS